jgi:hypothetical protein
MDFEQLKQLIIAKLSAEEVLDILGFDVEDLVEALEDEIFVFEEEFREAIDD